MIWFIMLLMVFLWSPVYAQTTYYVNFCTGNDGNTGLSSGQAWKTPNQVNTGAGVNDTIYYAPNCTHTMTDNNTLVAKSGQTHTMEAGCVGTAITSLPTIDGNNTWPTTGTGNRALFNIDGVDNVEVSCLRFINSNLNGVRIRNFSQNPRLISIVTGGHSNQIITQSASTADPNPAMLNAVIENVYGFAATDMAQLCNESTGTVARYNSFIGPMQDPVMGCNNSINTGSTHEIGFNIVRSSASGRRTVSSGVDVTGGGQPLVSRNVWFHNNVIYNADNGCLEPFITTGVANVAGAEQIVDNHIYEYNTCAKLHVGSTNRGCWDYNDNRTTADSADWSNLTLRNNICIGSGTEVGLRTSPSGINLTVNSNNAYHSSATFNGEGEGVNRQNVSTTSFRNYSGDNYNLVASATALLNGATDPQMHIGAMQAITFPAGACTIETATPNKMCCKANSQYSWDTSYSSGVCSYASIPITVVSAPARTSTGCTLQSTAGEFCIDFSGSAVTQGQGPITVNFPAGVLGAGQVGSRYDTAMLRHENIAYTNFSVVNNVGANPSFGNLRQINYRFRQSNISGEAFTNRTTVLNGVLNNPVNLARNGIYQVAMELDCTGGNPCQSTSFAPFGCDGSCETPGNWYLLGTSYAGKMLRRVNSNNVVSLASTTQSLTSCGTFVNGRFIDAAASTFPTFNLGSGQCTKFVVVFQINPAASFGQELRINMQRSDGTDLVSSVDAVMVVSRPRVIR